MKEIRKLNGTGLEKFSKFIEAFALGQKPPIPNELKRDDSWTNVLGRGERDLDTVEFSSQWAMARDLHDLFAQAGITETHTQDPGLWAWLSIVYFEKICPRRKGGEWSPGPLNLWVPSTSWQRFYRNFLVGPYRVYTLHKSRPDLTRAVLSGSPKVQTEIYAQIAASQEVVQSRGVLETVNKLYWDADNESLKRGHAGKGAGSARRFPVFMNQISLTWDLNDISGDELSGLLPAEYDRFK